MFRNSCWNYVRSTCIFLYFLVSFSVQLDLRFKESLYTFIISFFVILRPISLRRLFKSILVTWWCLGPILWRRIPKMTIVRFLRIKMRHINIKFFRWIIVWNFVGVWSFINGLTTVRSVVSQNRLIKLKRLPIWMKQFVFFVNIFFCDWCVR